MYLYIRFALRYSFLAPSAEMEEEGRGVSLLAGGMAESAHSGYYFYNKLSTNMLFSLHEPVNEKSAKMCLRCFGTTIGI